MEKPNSPCKTHNFRLQNRYGTIVGDATYTTQADAVLAVTGSGSYVVTETKAPDGYILSKQSKTVQIEKG